MKTPKYRQGDLMIQKIGVLPDNLTAQEGLKLLAGSAVRNEHILSAGKVYPKEDGSSEAINQ